jgi:hypothetical protein
MKTGAPKSEFPAIFGWCETLDGKGNPSFATLVMNPFVNLCTFPLFKAEIQ